MYDPKKTGKRQVQAKLKEYAKETFSRWGLPVDKYRWVAAPDQDGITWSVVGTYTNGKKVMLSLIWVSDLGDALQAGTNYGILTL